MRFYYITFRSVTHAQRGEQLLNQQGIRCALQRTPRWMEEKGCGYSLRVDMLDTVGAVELLRGAGIPLRRVYTQRPDGELEEMGL